MPHRGLAGSRGDRQEAERSELALEAVDPRCELPTDPGKERYINSSDKPGCSARFVILLFALSHGDLG
jgi:hypothetical protein